MPDEPVNPPAEPSAPPPPAPPPPTPADGTPPPAANTVLNGQRREGEVDLAAELEAEKKKRVDREKRLAELEDENHRLKQIPAALAPAPAKRKGSGWTFFDPED